MKIDCIADLHGYFPKLEGGDLLIVAGDLTARDREEEYVAFMEWLGKQTYELKVFIGGNHDNGLVRFTSASPEVVYLFDSGVEYGGLKIWGSPWTKRFVGINPRCMAFTVGLEVQLEEKWARIPEDTDILVTHSPPYGVLDNVGAGERCGSEALVKVLERVKPRLHVFGHIHEGGGQKVEYRSNLWCVNASYVDERYRPVHGPVRMELSENRGR